MRRRGANHQAAAKLVCVTSWANSLATDRGETLGEALGAVLDAHCRL